MAARAGVPKWLSITAVVVALVGGLIGIGLISPGWASEDALDKVERRSRRCCQECKEGVAEINGKLDIILLEVRK